MTWTDPAYREVATLIGERTGLVFPASRHADVEAALRHVLPDPSDLDRLAGLLAAEDEAREELVARLTIGESYFFRDPAQFELLRNEVLPALADARSGVPLRLWSAGCAGGEEPYSLAILCAELGLGNAHIIGTDISRARLAHARAGVYRPWALRGLPARVLDAWFERDGARFALRPQIRDRVEFRYLNLAEDRFPSLTDGVWGMDVILCRNVLIYFDRVTIERVAARLIDCLSEDGWLICGASDPAIGEIVDCDVVLTPAGLAYRRPRPGAVGAWQLTVAPTGGLPQQPAPPPAQAALPPPAPREPAVPAGAADDADDAAALERAYAGRDYAAVDALAARMIATNPGPRPWIVRVRALANRGFLNEAGRAAAAALERHRDSAELLYLHAVLLSESGRHADAAAALRRALYLDPSLAVAHLALADARARLGDRLGQRRALRAAQELLALLPADAVVPASDGQRAGRLARHVRTRLALATDAA